MGLVRTPLTLANPKRPDLAPLTVEALVDTGTVHVCVPERVAVQLDLEELKRREVTVADGSTHSVPYVGPIVTAFGRRHGYTGAMVLGDDVLLGAIPMEDMDLIVQPMTREVVANPRSPNIPASIAMGFKSFTKVR
jgi:clan AA aspartic protease